MTPMRLSDDAIRNALGLDPQVTAPLGLAADIRAAVVVTPQRTPRLGWTRTARGRAAIWIVALLLLLLALVVAGLVVGALRKQSLAPLVNEFHGGPTRTGIMPGPGPQGTLEACWKPVQLDGTTSTFTEPAVADGVVYIADDSGVVWAVDEVSGAQIWHTPPLNPIYSSPAIFGTGLLVGSDDGTLYFIDRASGSVLWTYRASGKVRSPPAVVDGIAYFGSDSGMLYALDLTTGKSVWEQQMPGPVDRAVSAADGLVFAGSGSTSPTHGDGSFDAYSMATGKPAWPEAQSFGPGQVSTSAVEGGRVFVASGLDASQSRHAVYAFDESAGQPSWTTPFSSQTNATLVLSAVADGLVFAAGGDGNVYALDEATGTEKWFFALTQPLGAGGAYVDGVLYVVGDDGQLHEIDTSNGDQVGTPFTIGGGSAVPTVIDGRVLVGTGVGTLSCVTGSNNSSPTP
jgi:outer membrane protein assembly factor BamB